MLNKGVRRGLFCTGVHHTVYTLIPMNNNNGILQGADWSAGWAQILLHGTGRRVSDHWFWQQQNGIWSDILKSLSEFILWDSFFFLWLLQLMRHSCPPDLLITKQTGLRHERTELALPDIVTDLHVRYTLSGFTEVESRSRLISCIWPLPNHLWCALLMCKPDFFSPLGRRRNTWGGTDLRHPGNQYFARFAPPPSQRYRQRWRRCFGDLFGTSIYHGSVSATLIQ